MAFIITKRLFMIKNLAFNEFISHPANRKIPLRKFIRQVRQEKSIQQ